MELSTAPVWLNERFEPRPVVLRAYVAANGDSFSVMPGGLARVSTASEDPIVSMQSGGGSKDIWVLSDEPVSRTSLFNSAATPIHAMRAAGEVPSRVADHLYWLGRYVERLEDIARLLRCVVTRVADDAGPESQAEVAALCRALVGLDLLPARFPDPATLEDLESEILQIVYKTERVGGVREILGRVRSIAAVVRDRCSADTWSILHKLQVDEPTRIQSVPMTGVLAQLNTLIVDLSAFSGMEMENMTRGLGWRFLDFGRRLERSLHITQLLRAALVQRVKTNAILEPVLEIADSVMTYRRRYFSGAQLSSVLELLLKDETNPRAFAFQLAAMAEHASQMPDDLLGGDHGADKKRSQALLERLRRARTWELAQAWEHGAGDPLESLLTGFIHELGVISNDLSHLYFTHTVPRVS